MAFVGGINLIDDRHDMNHGWSEAPRLDFAVQIEGPLVQAVHATTRAMWARAHLAREWRHEVRTLVRGERPAQQAIALIRQLRGAPGAAELPPKRRRCAPPSWSATTSASAAPSSAAMSMRSATRANVSTSRCRTSTPGAVFAARCARPPGVASRCGCCCRARSTTASPRWPRARCTTSCKATACASTNTPPAFLHAKVACVDDDWATVGSSNIDPLSLLLNLEANVVVRDPAFVGAMAARFDAAFAVSTEVPAGLARGGGWRGWLRRAVIAAAANAYLRVAGITGRY